MFVVAPVARKELPDTTEYGRHYPIVFEHEDHPNSTAPIAHRDTREQAQKVADALNKVLTAK